MLDLVIRRANLPDGRREIDIACQDGRIVEVAANIDAPQAALEIDAAGCLVTPPFVDSHFHLDSTLSYGRPRVNRSGTLLEGIALWGEFAQTISADDVKERARALCHWAIARGNLAIRSHVDVSKPELIAVRALLELREELKPYLDLQLVAFPQEGYLRNPAARAALAAALDLGVDVVGGIPHFERTMAEGGRSVTMLCELAAERGLPVDLHCDESDDPLSRHIETLAHETVRLGLQARVTGSHLTSMHAMDDDYVSKLLRLMREARLHAVANPLINITLQGRHDAYPKRRGMTRVKEMMDCDVNVSFGHDCVMDPWYALGSHDMLEVAHMGLHVAHMTGVDEMRACFDAVTRNGARTLELQSYGLEPGCHADMVVLQASDTIEALRTHPARLHVIRRGRVIASTPKTHATLTLGEQRVEVDFVPPPPRPRRLG
ncbi:MAG: amidohydrolase family protein [Gammaproteobacteria bacterium]|nr:MAG: amidohydrolase family protein [Gammaproteobacteria bacterium]